MNTDRDRIGAFYVLTALFLLAWLGQLLVMLPTVREQGWLEFWSATLENWQSEFLQLACAALLMTILARQIWRISTEQLDRIEAMVAGLRGSDLSDEQVARAFHETYERLAPAHSYTTRTESAVPWERVPANSRALMEATVRALRAQGVIR